MQAQKEERTQLKRAFTYPWNHLRTIPHFRLPELPTPFFLPLEVENDLLPQTSWRILLNFGYWRNFVIPWPSLLPSRSTWCLCYALLMPNFLKGSQKCVLPTVEQVSQGRLSLKPSGINSIFMANNNLQSLNWKTLTLFSFSYLCQHKYFLGISTTSLCFNSMFQHCGGDGSTPLAAGSYFV